MCGFGASIMIPKGMRFKEISYPPLRRDNARGFPKAGTISLSFGEFGLHILI